MPDPTEIVESLTDPTPAETPQEDPDDAWLSSHDSQEEEVGVVEPEATESVSEETQEEAPEASTEQPAPEEKPATQPEELQKALSVLHRDGFTTDDLNVLPDETILRMAEKRAGVQADVDRAYQELKSLKAASETSSDPGKSDASPTQAEAAPDSLPQVDLKELVAPLAEHLALDKEGTEALVTFQQQAMAPLLATMAEQTKLVQQAQNAVMQLEEQRAREALGERFPQVSDPSSADYGRVTERMAALAKTGDYTDMAKLMEDAVTIEFASELRAEARKATETLNRRKSNGQVSTQTKAAAPEALTNEQKEDAVLEMLESDDPLRVEKARNITGV